MGHYEGGYTWGIPEGWVWFLVMLVFRRLCGRKKEAICLLIVPSYTIWTKKRAFCEENNMSLNTLHKGTLIQMKSFFPLINHISLSF